MAPRKVTKDQLLNLLSDHAPDEQKPTVSSLQAADIVTYPALTGILTTLEERHNGLVSLMNQRFSTLEAMSVDRSNQLTKAETALNIRISEERHEVNERIKDLAEKSDKRFTSILVALSLAFLAEVVRFFVGR